LEQKSEKIQALVTITLSNIFNNNDQLTIETPSFLLNHFVLNSSNLTNVLIIENSIIQLPSFCDLTYLILNCTHQSIIIKVRNKS